MSTSTTATDAQLVAAHIEGDPSALAAIYDRYADSLYDTAAAMTRDRHDGADVTQDVFVAAAERMGQLRDADRLKPWLFAILRNEVYRRSGKKKRVVLTDFTDSSAEMNLPTEPPVEAEDAEYQELAQLVRDAAAGLDERDQLVLEYSIRQGLEGGDLADALGVTPQQCYGLVHRMRQRTERSLGAFCVARTGRKDCADLAQILGDWDGQFSVLVRKRVARHVDQCDVCERSRRKLAPFAMFGTAPAFAAPPELRQRVLAAAEPGGGVLVYGFAAPGGFPTVIKYARRMAGWLILTVLAVLIAGGATVFVLLHDGDAQPAAAPASDSPGRARLPASPSTARSPVITIVDETAPVTAQLSLVDPTGLAYGPIGTAVKGTEHSAAIDFGVVATGNWTWTLTASDGFGNVGTASGITVVSPQPCP